MHAPPPPRRLLHSSLIVAQDYTIVDTSPPEIHPLGGVDEPKRRFLPSKWERMKARNRTPCAALAASHFCLFAAALTAKRAGLRR